MLNLYARFVLTIFLCLAFISLPASAQAFMAKSVFAEGTIFLKSGEKLDGSVFFKTTFDKVHYKSDYDLPWKERREIESIEIEKIVIDVFGDIWSFEYFSVQRYNLMDETPSIHLDCWLVKNELAGCDEISLYELHNFQTKRKKQIEIEFQTNISYAGDVGYSYDIATEFCLKRKDEDNPTSLGESGQIHFKRSIVTGIGKPNSLLFAERYFKDSPAFWEGVNVENKKSKSLDEIVQLYCGM